LWKDRENEAAAQGWYLRCLEFVRKLPPGRRPPRAFTYFTRYASFLARKKAPDLAAATKVAREALEYARGDGEVRDATTKLMALYFERLRQWRQRALDFAKSEGGELEERELVEMCRHLLSESRGSDKKRATAMIGGNLFLGGLTPHQRSKLARVVAQGNADLLLEEWRRDGRNDEALRWLIAIIDNYAAYLQKETIVETRHAVEVRMVNREEFERLRSLLVDWLQEKDRWRWPSRFNSSLLSFDPTTRESPQAH
jgi:hypothetical protein